MNESMHALTTRWNRLTAWDALGLSPATRPLDASGLLTSAYLSVMLFGLPLVLHNGYFDVTETKWIFYCVVSAAYLIMLAVLWIAGKRKAAVCATRAGPICGADACLLAFALSFLLATLLSGNWSEGLWGAHNRYQGIVTIFLYVGVTFALAKHFRVSRAALLALLGGFCLVTLLAAGNGFRMDPLGVCSRLSAFDRGRYVSTLGNINFYSGYLGLMLPFIFALWCHAETPFWRVATGFALVCGALGMLPSGSESLLAALLTAGLLLPLTLMPNPRALRRLFAGGMLMLITLAVATLLGRVRPPAQTPSFFIRSLTRPLVLLGLFALCALLYAAMRRCTDDALQRLRKPYIFTLCGGLLLLILVVVLANTRLRNVSFGALEPFLKWGPGWGTDRGRIWAYCMDVFARFGWQAKLFGGGTDVLYALDSGMAFFGDAVLDNAHNEYLHYLLTVGIWGLAAYMGALLCTLRAALRTRTASPLASALSLGVIGYAAQAFFNIAQPVSTPFLFLFLGMAAGACVRDTAADALALE